MVRKVVKALKRYKISQDRTYFVSAKSEKEALLLTRLYKIGGLDTFQILKHAVYHKTLTMLPRVEMLPY